MHSTRCRIFNPITRRMNREVVRVASLVNCELLFWVISREPLTSRLLTKLERRNGASLASHVHVTGSGVDLLIPILMVSGVRGCVGKVGSDS